MKTSKQSVSKASPQAKRVATRWARDLMRQNAAKKEYWSQRLPDSGN